MALVFSLDKRLECSSWRSINKDLWSLDLPNDWLVVVVYSACSRIWRSIMMELSKIMNSTIILLIIMVVGGSGALLEWVCICNLAGSWV